MAMRMYQHFQNDFNHFGSVTCIDTIPINF